MSAEQAVMLDPDPDVLHQAAADLVSDITEDQLLAEAIRTSKAETDVIRPGTFTQPLRTASPSFSQGCLFEAA